MNDAVETDEATTVTLGLTPDAAVKAKELMDREGRDDLNLRLQVSPGGCSGLKYALYFSPESDDKEGDVHIEHDNGVVLVTDRMSYPYLTSAVVSFTDTIEKQGFSITNEGAAGTCACGESFH